MPIEATKSIQHIN